jgi:GDP-mannose 6-dehydrogenase
MRISIFGLGYVGSVLAGCFANDGHEVIGIDPVQNKVDLLNNGKPPVIEKDVDLLFQKAISNGTLKASTDSTEGVMNSEISLICVGTPPKLNGELDLQYVRRVCEKIGTALKNKNDYHLVALRSTVLPGTCRDVVIPILEKSSQKIAGKDFGVCVNPEFLREGSGVDDFHSPAKLVIGAIDEKSSNLMISLNKKIKSSIILTDFETAEMIKYTDNAWHALKITFANEIGNICKELQIDSHRLMDIFCQDTKLNISSNYLRPGFAFGGSCLPKDVRALIHRARKSDLDIPVINSICTSNALQIKRGLQMIQSHESKKIGILGFSFKEGTDDLRESPVVEIIELLLGKGYDIKIYDSNVNLAKIIGANKEFIFERIPHIANVMVDDMQVVIDHADILVLGTKSSEFKSVLGKVTNKQIIIDLVRITENFAGFGNYHGICW